jgi:hypothetical protein
MKKIPYLDKDRCVWIMNIFIRYRNWQSLQKKNVAPLQLILFVMHGNEVILFWKYSAYPSSVIAHQRARLDSTAVIFMYDTLIASQGTLFSISAYRNPLRAVFFNFSSVLLCGANRQRQLYRTTGHCWMVDAAVLSKVFLVCRINVFFFGLHRINVVDGLINTAVHELRSQVRYSDELNHVLLGRAVCKRLAACGHHVLCSGAVCDGSLLIR